MTTRVATAGRPTQSTESAARSSASSIADQLRVTRTVIHEASSP